MKAKNLEFFVLFLFIVKSAYSQEAKSTPAKDELKIEKQNQIETMVNAREFVFVARIANPSGGRSVNLAAGTNFMKFSPDMIESDMPYYGRAYASAGYGSDGGLKFIGRPEKFTVKKKKKGYDITVFVKGKTDQYNIYITVTLEGRAMISVNSNNRSNISYTGDISSPGEHEEKK